MTKRKRLGDAAKPGSYEVNSAFCNTVSHDKHEEQRLGQAQAEIDLKARKRREGRSIGVPNSTTYGAPKKSAAAPAPGGTPVSIGKDGKVFMSKAARRKLKKAASAPTQGCEAQPA
jgi:hypothetical protein